ncbi:MAG: hypothetical protein UX02_C0001G0127 [Candidatus Moranbacteria bacterium GW2011_GWC1_45_18]|nr:MAG: hypothetical protein UT79_C0002G0270 [Candidatus Moranbacteria bacterium GW2011_GWC2_40_12]KKT34108.1 MAG: hypothetical protein UW19_C0001G0003 [Candidatus Moranbacteria bacterium GW2011_GWF2_44_10]KKT69803.1 MAG: hypothetical protein UW66_C0061G0007 [Candidatus Moranbacteria bacterium GW2011_GWF1_44_4]KKU00679.1 MAG: hypothetical protein UX02_C0001G0127 [Candidatus Moranbacteria bacterium GW2011_GWC1_45_18]
MSLRDDFYLGMIEGNIRKNLILSADDFGKSELANKNILKLAKAGKLDRISVMVDGGISQEEAMELLAVGVKVDIHFELIWQKRRRNLLKDHTLRQGIVFFANYLWGDWPVPEHPRSGTASVKREWKDQIEKFRKIFNRLPDGISSHEHVHYFPAYFSIALELADSYEIPFVRFGNKGFAGKRNSVYLILKIMRWLNKKKFFCSNVSSSDYFASLDWIENFGEFLKNIPEGQTEIACHPERMEEYNFALNNL